MEISAISEKNTKFEQTATYLLWIISALCGWHSQNGTSPAQIHKGLVGM